MVKYINPSYLSHFLLRRFRTLKIHSVMGRLFPHPRSLRSNFSNGRHVVNESQRFEESGGVSVEELKELVKSVEKKSGSVAKMAVEEEREWNDEDFELLNKQMAKHPVGMPRRWEVITESFRGRHKMENVVKMAKSMPERKLNDGDSFARFLKDRKPLDKRSETGNDELIGNGEKKEKEGLLVWSAEEDIALLNALKAFPKDASMRPIGFGSRCRVFLEHVNIF